MSNRHLYQRCKPMTDKNIGKNLLKRGKKEYPAGGSAKELARAAKRLAHPAATHDAACSRPADSAPGL